MKGLTEIRAQRAQLMARAAMERERICVQLQPWEARLALADRGISAARYLQRNPQWIIGAAALIVALRPKRAISWARNGLIAWRSWRWVVRWLNGPAARRWARASNPGRADSAIPRGASAARSSGRA